MMSPRNERSLPEIETDQTIHMKLKLINVAILAAALTTMASVSSGCAWSIGGKEGATVHQTTKGQELIDLKRAKESGAMSEDEYQAQRKRILEK
jgi:hypothetical protein